MAPPSLKILLADDDPDILEMLGAYMAARGHQIQLAHDGEEALQLLQAGPVDVLVSDIRMPRMGGLELLKRVRAQGWPMGVVMTTGFSDLDQAVATLKAGADDFMRKPFRLSDLHDAAVAAMHKAKREREALRSVSVANISEVAHSARGGGLRAMLDAACAALVAEVAGAQAIVALPQPGLDWLAVEASSGGAPLRGLDVQALGRRPADSGLGDGRLWAGGNPTDVASAPVPVRAPGRSAAGVVALVAPTLSVDMSALLRIIGRLLGDAITRELALGDAGESTTPAPGSPPWPIGLGERADGSGYPHGRTEAEMDPSVARLAVELRWYGLTRSDGWLPPLDSTRARQRLRSEAGHALAAGAVEDFLAQR